MDVKSRFRKRIYDELQMFKETVISQDKENIFAESYKIDMFINLYEILLEQMDSMSDSVMLALLNRSEGILESLYDTWLKKEDSSYEELKQHVLEEVE